MILQCPTQEGMRETMFDEISYFDDGIGASILETFTDGMAIFLAQDSHVLSYRDEVTGLT